MINNYVSFAFSIRAVRTDSALSLYRASDLCVRCVVRAFSAFYTHILIVEFHGYFFKVSIPTVESDNKLLVVISLRMKW